MIIDHKCTIHGYLLVHLPREAAQIYGEVRFKCPLRDCSYTITRRVLEMSGDILYRGDVISDEPEMELTT